MQVFDEFFEKNKILFYKKIAPESDFFIFYCAQKVIFQE